MNKCVLALSTALSVFAIAPAFAQNNQAPAATVDCTVAANANDPACMKNGSGATGGMTTDSTTGSTTQPADQTQAKSMTSGDLFVPADQLNNAHVMSANDYIGKTVYDQNGNNIGEVNDLVMSDNGDINAVILGVGGFLGIGEKDVAVSVRSIKAMKDTASATTTTTDTTNNSASNSTNNNTTTMASDDTLNNSRLVVETTKEALEAAPTYDKVNRRYVQSNQ